MAQYSAVLGVTVGEAKIDLKIIKARKDEIVEASRTGLGDWLGGNDNISIYRATAKLTGPNTVQVGEEELSADKIFLNVGGRPRIPEGFADINYLTNQSILELEEIPEHLIVVGGGYIGLEFAQMFRRFGSKVTLVEMADRLVKREDEDISTAIMDILEGEGIELRMQATCLSGREENGKIIVNLKCEKGPPEVACSHLLLATGRVPNTDDLGLELAGVETNERGYIMVNDQLQTKQAHIYALGDCNGQGAFTHTAYNDYQVASNQLLGDASRTLSDRLLCYGLYIDPAFARVGLSERDLESKGLAYRKAFRPMKRIARAKEMGETQGFLKILIAADSDQVLGAAFLGTGADEYIHAVIDLMYVGAPYTVIRDAVHIHPTISELIPTMLESLELINPVA